MSNADALKVGSNDTSFTLRDDSVIAHASVYLLYYATQKTLLIIAKDNTVNKSNCLAFQKMYIYALSAELEAPYKDTLAAMYSLRGDSIFNYMQVYGEPVDSMELWSYYKSHDGTTSDDHVIDGCIEYIDTFCDVCGDIIDAETKDNHAYEYQIIEKPAWLVSQSSQESFYLQRECTVCSHEDERVYEIGLYGYSESHTENPIYCYSYKQGESYPSYDSINLPHIYKDGVCLLCGHVHLVDGNTSVEGSYEYLLTYPFEYGTFYGTVDWTGITITINGATLQFGYEYIYDNDTDEPYVDGNGHQYYEITSTTNSDYKMKITKNTTSGKYVILLTQEGGTSHTFEVPIRTIS